jgi:hypothetical protein
MRTFDRKQPARARLPPPGAEKRHVIDHHRTALLLDPVIRTKREQKIKTLAVFGIEQGSRRFLGASVAPLLKLGPHHLLF